MRGSVVKHGNGYSVVVELDPGPARQEPSRHSGSATCPWQACGDGHVGRDRDGPVSHCRAG